MGVIMLTVFFLILVTGVFMSQPILDHIHSRSVNDIKATSESIVFGILFPLAAAGLYSLARQKKNRTAER
jgi:cytochrome b subunit of formate dehydrogenase